MQDLKGPQPSNLLRPDQIFHRLPPPNQLHPLAIHQHLGRPRPAIVIRRQRHAIRTRIQNRKQVAFLPARRSCDRAQEVAALADRAHDVHGLASSPVRSGHDRHNLVISVVERGTNQVIHRRVHHHKLLPVISLAIDDARQQHASRRDNGPPRLQQQMYPIPCRAAQRRSVANLARKSTLGVVFVRNAQPAAGVHIANVMPVRPQRPHQNSHALQRFLKRLGIGDLRADVHADAMWLQIVLLSPER